MVWFQYEDCGENLNKPKLANHFRMFSDHKLSGIDCGKMFDQQSVQSHTQCITEAEKYGPKGQGNASQNGQTKPDKPKKNSDVDINVGLSSHAPWFGSGNKIASASASPCAQLRAAYHDCFNRWYSEKFSKGQWDKEECVAQWDKYRACLAQHLEDKHLRSILLGAGTSVQPTDNEDFSSLDADGDFRH